MSISRRERELVFDLFELITGLRMNHPFIRPAASPRTFHGGARRDPRLPGPDEDEPPRVRPTSATPTRSSRDVSRRSVTSTWPAVSPWAGPVRRCGRPDTRGTSARPSPTAATRPSTLRKGERAVGWAWAGESGQFESVRCLCLSVVVFQFLRCALAAVGNWPARAFSRPGRGPRPRQVRRRCRECRRPRSGGSAR